MVGLDLASLLCKSAVRQALISADTCIAKLSVTHFQVLRQERVLGVLVHAPLVWHLRALPHHAVCVVHNDVLPFCDIYCPGWVCRDVDFHYSVAVI